MTSRGPRAWILRASYTSSRCAFAAALLWCCASGPANGALPTPEGAWAEGGFDGREARLEARLLLHPEDSMASGAVRVGVLFELDPGWHLYWRNPGDSGLPTRLQWRVAPGRVEGMAWPAPRSFRESGGELVTYGYADRVLLAGRWVPAPGSRSRTLGVQVEGLVCNAQCLPVRLSLERTLTEGPAPEGPSAAHRELGEVFAHFERRVPRAAAESEWQLDVSYSPVQPLPQQRFSGVISARACPRDPSGGGCAAPGSALDGAAFFPYLLEGLEVESIEVGRPHEPERTSTIALAARIDEAGGAPPDRLRGVLVFPGDEQVPLEIDLPLPRLTQAGDVPPGQPPGVEAARAPGMLVALVFALLGGLVLNLMPCVFPVLAIKGVALAELAGRSQRERLAHVCGYLAGIVSALLALAAVVVALRAGGSAVGWGFQLQEPRFVVALSVVLVLFATHLMGSFELTLGFGRLGELGAHAHGATRSFCDGLLAVLLATPCSAPFLGTAVGFALARPAFEIVAIFVAIGVGLAAPYVLLAALPATTAWLPRPGAWMLRLRSALGFAVLGVVVWLVWILGRSAGVDSAAALLLRVWVVAFLAWSLGLLQRAGHLHRAHGLVAAICLAVLALVPVGDGSQHATPRVRVAAYDRGAIDAALAEGQRVFAYFTADWCITCKVNERVVLANERVEQALAAPDVSVFRADWTRRDESIRAQLARYGRAGVPTYLVLQPHGTERVQVLPELLTVDRLLRALDAASGPLEVSRR